MRRIASLRRVVAASAVLTIPATAALVLLVATENLTPGAALIALVGIIALTALILRPYLSDLGDAVAFARSLALGSTPTLPEPRRAGPAEEVSAAISQMTRSWAQNRQALEAQLASQEAVIDSLPDPLLMLNAQRRVVRTNRAARLIFGQDLAGRELAAILRDPNILEACDEVLAGARGREVEFTLPMPVERELLASIQPLPMRVVDGSLVVLALHDVTALRRAEQMRADFVANASHELRTPLATLLGFIETLRGSARDDAEARERFLGIMFDQGSRMARLVNDLLSLSRIELNEHTQPSDPVDVPRILNSLADTLVLQAKAKKMSIVLEIDDALPPVPGQPDELTQVFQNLLDNAIKYGRENSEVLVVATIATDIPPAMSGQCKASGVVKISVCDQGDGIAREHLPRLTERFFRVDTARSRSLGGTGLGLAIVKHVVNRHRGAMTVTSVVGRGSQFTIFLPCWDAKAASRLDQTIRRAATG